MSVFSSSSFDTIATCLAPVQRGKPQHVRPPFRRRWRRPRTKVSRFARVRRRRDKKRRTPGQPVRHPRPQRRRAGIGWVELERPQLPCPSQPRQRTSDGEPQRANEREPHLHLVHAAWRSSWRRLEIRQTTLYLDRRKGRPTLTPSHSAASTLASGGTDHSASPRLWATRRPSRDLPSHGRPQSLIPRRRQRKDPPSWAVQGPRLLDPSPSSAVFSASGSSSGTHASKSAIAASLIFGPSAHFRLAAVCRRHPRTTLKTK